MTPLRRRLNRRRLYARTLRARLGRVGPAFGGALVGVTGGVWWLEHDVPGSHITSLGDAAWFTVVTLATVGYGDVYPVTAAGRALTGVFILFTLTAVGLVISAINEAVLEVRRMEEMGLIGTDMEKHVIVCGFGPVARAALEELLAAGRKVALICDRAEEIAAAQRFAPREQLFVTAGDLTQDVLRDRLNVAAAETAVIATDDDTRNIVASLNVRALNPGARVIVAVKTEALRQTLIASGVTYVASPYELSGRLVASAAFEPEVAHFVEDVTSGVDDGHDLQQYSAAPFAGLTVRAVRDRLADADGPLLVGVATWREGGRYEIRPHPPLDLVLEARDQVIVLASAAQAKRLAADFDVHQGR